MTTLDYTLLFETPHHLCMYETDGKYTIVNVADGKYPRMIPPTERHLAAAWALAFKAENPGTVMDRQSFVMVDRPHSERVSNVFPIRMHDHLDEVGA